MRSFADLFRGRDDAYGRYGSIAYASPTDRGKRVGRANTVTEHVTVDLFPAFYKAHLAGEQRLGIAPVLPNNTCWWFCIDVDFYQELGLYTDIATRIRECGLPLVMTKSKSGGIHLWCFFSAPILASKARDMAVKFCKKLKLPDKHIDIFPAQDNVGYDAKGNWVNIPYFGDVCHGLGESGEEDLTLEQFLAYANDRIQTAEDLAVKSHEKVQARKSGAPPCIDWMNENGVPEGYRNHAVTQFAIYARKAFSDDWKERAQNFNDDACEQPLSSYELKPIFKSIGTKDYAYLCDKIKPMFCDLKECKLREYGVGGGTPGVEINIERIEKIDGEEPIYRVTIDGKRFQVTLDQLFLYNAFKKTALGAVNRFLPPLKQHEWEEFMRERLELMEIEEAAADTQMKDRVINLFERFAENSTTESLRVAVERGTCFYDGDNIVFRGDEFMSIVDRQLNRLPRERIWAYMRDHGCVLADYTVEGTKMKFWKWVREGRNLWFNPDGGQQA